MKLQRELAFPLRPSAAPNQRLVPPVFPTSIVYMVGKGASIHTRPMQWWRLPLHQAPHYGPHQPSDPANEIGLTEAFVNGPVVNVW